MRKMQKLPLTHTRFSLTDVLFFCHSIYYVNTFAALIVYLCPRQSCTALYKDEEDTISEELIF